MKASDWREDGFALVIVLWVVAILALMTTYVIEDARDRLALDRQLNEAAVLRCVADGAARHAIFEVLSGHWSPDGTVRTVRVGGRPVTVRLEDESIKVNPNVATANTLRHLFESVSVDARTAAELARAIVESRAYGDDDAPSDDSGQSDAASAAPRRSFTSLRDLLLVRGMTPEILEKSRPHLTLFAGTDPDLTEGDGIGAIRIVSVTADARGSRRARFTRRLIARTNARRSGRRYEILMSEQVPAEDNSSVAPVSPRDK